jgi:hypothetical protein
LFDVTCDFFRSDAYFGPRFDGGQNRFRPPRGFVAPTIEEYEAMRAHVRGKDFPETTSQWYSLGREAGCGRVWELFVAPTGPVPDVLLSGVRCHLAFSGA